MPTPPRTSLDAIVAAARSIVDVESLDALSMDRVAAAVGVRAPSLYKHVRDRGDLVHLVANDAAADLGDRVAAAATTGDARSDVRAMADALRGFAHASPGSYRLLFERLPDGWRADHELSERAVQPLFRTVARLAGDGRELEASRTVVAWASGFVAMELAEAFKLGGDVDTAWEYGVERLVHAIAEPSKPG